MLSKIIDLSSTENKVVASNSDASAQMLLDVRFDPQWNKVKTSMTHVNFRFDKGESARTTLNRP